MTNPPLALALALGGASATIAAVVLGERRAPSPHRAAAPCPAPGLCDAADRLGAAPPAATCRAGPAAHS